MMKPVLESLALHLIRTSSGVLGDMRIILPNRRAGLFLQRHLALHAPVSSWAPRIYTISEFIDETSILRQSDPIELLFTLYDIYRNSVELPDSLDEFYLWGEMILRDFDELDKYLVDVQMLFSNIIDLKELEEPLAGLEPEQLKFIKQFWTGFHGGEQTPEKDQFLKSWLLLPLLYGRFRTELSSRGEAYQGMQYREIADRIEGGKIDFSWSGRTIVAGFNALNACEERIFSALQRKGAEFYWDYDHLYCDRGGIEAGRFIRHNMLKFPPEVQLEEFTGLSQQKKIRIFELPTDVLQAKTVHTILESKESEAAGDCTDTAVVLCDEDLLLPVMMSLPRDTGEINVTMGYPMKNTPVYSFIDTLLRLQHNKRKGPNGKVQFYYQDVVSILLHPYFRRMKKESSESLLMEIHKNNLFRVDQDLFTEGLERSIFRLVTNAIDLLDYLKTVFNHILETLSGEEDLMQDSLDREFIFHLLTHLNKLESFIAKRPEISGDLMERLLKKLLSILRIPFEGEPLSGLQLMGILETRMLDFRHVIILSMNEEVMPAANAPLTNIPYSLRLAFRMPAREDMDAIYAYYFYRLLQRAERVDLIYNGATEGMRTGEMSRYLHQLIFSRELDVIRPGMEVLARETEPLVIPHSFMADKKLMEYRTEGEGERILSPSAVNTYIDCSLKFYLKYIAGIGEDDQVSEELDPAGFGTVVHDTLKELYSEIADNNNRQVTREGLSRLMKSNKAEEVLRKVFLKEHFKGRKHEILEGRNIIVFRVMLRYLERIIRTDLGIAPFELVSAEGDYQRTLEIEVNKKKIRIRMGGKVDRIDRVKGSLRVIDYKTGQTSQRFSTLESLFDRQSGSRNPAAMQTLFYAWLAGEKYPGEKIMPGLYTMRGLFEDQFDPALTMTSLKKDGRIESFLDHEETYLGLLKEVLKQLFDPGVPFDQRENDIKCSYCDFADICQRKSLD